MNKIVLSILAGILVFILSYIFSKDMRGANTLYTFVLSMNLSIFSGVLTHDLFWSIKNKALFKNESIKSGLITGVTTMIIMLSAFLGVEALFETHSPEKLLLKLLILSTGWVGVVLGGLIKYLVVVQPNKKHEC